MPYRVTIAIAAIALAAAAPVPPGTYTNEEEVYFDTEAKRAPAPWIGLTVDAGGAIVFIDRFGEPIVPTSFSTIDTATVPDRIRLGLPSRVSELRKARSFICWGAALKMTKRSDGTDDWFGAAKLKLHDQGGRVRFGGGETGAPETILRMRNVIWPSGPNRPSLVLYVHTPAELEKAVSYSWADKDARTVGINLRWMQASCTLDS